MQSTKIPKGLPPRASRRRHSGHWARQRARSDANKRRRMLAHAARHPGDAVARAARVRRFGGDPAR